MPVHLGEAGDEPLPLPVHDLRPARDLDFPARADGDDPVPSDDDSVVREGALSVHRDDRHILEDDGRGGIALRVCACDVCSEGEGDEESHERGGVGVPNVDTALSRTARGVRKCDRPALGVRARRGGGDAGSLEGVRFALGLLAETAFLG